MESLQEIEVESVVLTTTLYRLRKHYACQPRYDHLVSALGPDYGDKTPINLLDIIETNGTKDCLWALCATDQNCDMVARLMAADFAEAVLPLYERQYPNDTRPRVAIQAARDLAHGRIGNAAAARAAADATAKAAEAWVAARVAEATAWAAAARAAAEVAARAADAWVAAESAEAASAESDTWAAIAVAGAATRAAQAAIIRKYLKAEK